MSDARLEDSAVDGERMMVRLRLWSRGLARCNHCARMTRQEWETMCDCWLVDVAWWRRFVR